MGETAPPIPSFIAGAIDEIQRLTNFGRMVDLGFLLGANFPTLTSLFRRAVPDAPETSEGIATLISLGEELHEYAKEQSDAGMPYLRALLTIRYVTIMETVVQDAVTISLETVPSVLNQDEVRKIKGPVAELIAASAAERAEFFANALAQEVKAPLQTGIKRFEALLNAVGLGGPVDSAASRTVHELLQVRNVLVHRNGRADARFSKACPWLNIHPGEDLVVTSAMGERYRSVTLYYLIEIIKRWLHRAGWRDEISALAHLSSQALEKVQRQ